MLYCEKLLHGDQEFKPFPEFQDGKGKPMKQKTFPYKCEHYAKRYEVHGDSFIAYAIL